MPIPVQRCKGCKERYYNEEELVKCPACNDKRIEIIELNKCNWKKDFCDFALKNGECSQPTISLDLCFPKLKNRKKETIKIIKRHLKGIEKAVTRLEKE